MDGPAPSSPGELREDGSDAPRARLLVVDDDAAVLRSLRRALEHKGYQVLTAQSASEALAVLATCPVDVVLSDACMPAMTGAELLDRIRGADLDCEVVIMSAYTDASTALEALRGGAVGFIAKPFLAFEVLLFELERAAELKRLRRLTRGAGSLALGGPGDLVGTSAQMSEIVRRVSDVGALPGPLVIQGERGTGKRLLAAAVHRRSRRPGELVHAEAQSLSTTFAQVAALAKGGALCVTRVDDADELSLRRLLEHAVGETQTRLIFTVESAEVASAIRTTFPQACIMHLPPLRQRERDVLLLARYFVGRHVRRAGLAIEPSFDEAALAALSRYAWPGNVAELEDTIDEALALATGARIGLSALPAAIRGALPDASLVPLPRISMTLPYAEAKQQALDGFTRSYVKELLERHSGDIQEAASAARIEASSLRRLLRRARDGQ